MPQRLQSGRPRVARNEVRQGTLDLDKLDQMVAALLGRVATFKNGRDCVYVSLGEPRLTATFEDGNDLEIIQEELLQFVAVVYVEPSIRK